jgi:putative transposase
LWREEGLRVPRRHRRKRLGTSSAPGRPKADAPNRVWAVDFQFDATTDGRQVKTVSIIDEHTRERLGGLVDRSITGDRLIDELDRLALDRGHPAVLRCDNGPELACDAMADWAGERVALSSIPPGEPWRNGYVESFNARVRDECLNINIFWSLTHARVVITDWKHDYNHRRRHSSLGYQAPADHAAARHPPMNNSHTEWTSSRGPARTTPSALPSAARLRTEPHHRRSGDRSIRGLFEKLYIGEDGTVVGRDLTEPFAAFLDSRPAEYDAKSEAQTNADATNRCRPANVFATTFGEVRDGLDGANNVQDDTPPREIIFSAQGLNKQVWWAQQDSNLRPLGEQSTIHRSPRRSIYLRWRYTRIHMSPCRSIR